MDGDAPDVELLLASAEQHIAALKRDPRSAPMPGSRGAALRGHLLDLLGAVELRLAQAPDPAAPQAVRQAFARNIRQTIIVLQAAHAALLWLSATREPSVNLGSLYLTEEFALALVGSDVDLVVVPDPEYMYSTTSWPFIAIVRNTTGYSATTTRRPIVLNYPLSDSDRLLVHPIFAHELGHAAADEHDMVSKVETELMADATFTADFQALVTGSSLWPALSPAQRAGTLRAQLRAWIEELLCDHLALEAAGPAYVWSFGVFGMPFSYGQPAGTHPPNTVRVRLALEHMAKRGWNGFMNGVAPTIASWLDGIAADASLPLPPPFGFLSEHLLRRADVLQDAAIARIGANALDVQATEAEANDAADLLRRLILPVGLDGPLSSRGILIGGWKFGLERYGDSPRGILEASHDPVLNELVGKAIEMSTVSRTWRAT